MNILLARYESLEEACRPIGLFDPAEVRRAINEYCSEAVDPTGDDLPVLFECWARGADGYGLVQRYDIDARPITEQEAFDILANQSAEEIWR